jgi:hypothetical protein
MAQNCASANQKEQSYPAITQPLLVVKLAECMERTESMLDYQGQNTLTLNMAMKPKKLEPNVAQKTYSSCCLK